MSEENLYTFENPDYRKLYWHTTSHIMAQAVKRLYPQTKLAIGPSIENGFYYDFDSDVSFTPEVLEKIQAEMRKICKEKLKLERFELPRPEAIAKMAEMDAPYKVELIENLPEDAIISFYQQGEFVDLCAGPHMDSTGRIKERSFFIISTVFCAFSILRPQIKIVVIGRMLACASAIYEASLPVPHTKRVLASFLAR